MRLQNCPASRIINYTYRDRPRSLGLLYELYSVKEMSISHCVWDAATALGFTSLKPEQEETITQFTLGRDMFVALPTGYGKSLCYYCLPYVFDSVRKVENKSIVLVISPLVALMKDHAGNPLSFQRTNCWFCE